MNLSEKGDKSEKGDSEKGEEKGDRFIIPRFP